MENVKLFSHSRLLIIFITIYLILSAVAGEQKHNNHDTEYGPNAAERAIGFTTHAGSRGWTHIKSWINHAFLNIWPPDSKTDLDAPFPGGSKAGAGMKMKKAASKSFESGKTTAEKVAKLAVGAVQKTVERVKRSMSQPKDDGDQDL